MKKFVGLPAFVLDAHATGNEIQTIELKKTDYGFEMIYAYGNGHFVALPIPQAAIEWMIERLKQ